MATEVATRATEQQAGPATPSGADGDVTPSTKRKLEAFEAARISHQGRLAALLDEFDVEVEDRCNTLEKQAAELATSFRNQLAIELVKIPKRIRDMPMKTFLEEYGGDLNSVIEEDMRKQVDRFTPAVPRRSVVPSTPSSSTSTSMSALRSGKQPKRRGGTAIQGMPSSTSMSMSTSTSASMSMTGTRGGGNSKSKILLQGDDGMMFDLMAAKDAKNVLQQQLSVKSRKEAFAQLKQLHDQVEALMSTLQ